MEIQCIFNDAEQTALRRSIRGGIELYGNVIKNASGPMKHEYTGPEGGRKLANHKKHLAALKSAGEKLKI